MSGQVVGIDIGSVSLRAMEVSSSDKSNPDVVRYHEVALPAGSAQRGEVIEVSTVATALKRLWSEGGFTSREVIIGMGGSRVLARDLSLPAGPMAQIKESLAFHVGDLLPVPVSEAILDFYPIADDFSENGPVVKGLLVAVVKEAVQANVAAATEAGLRVVQADLTPFALARALAPRRTSRGLAAIVSIGANSTNIIIVRDGVPQFVRIVAGGGDDITAELATQMQVSRSRAEEVKKDAGLGSASTLPEQRAVTTIVQEVANRLFSSIRDTLSFYMQNHSPSEFDRLILAGGGSFLPGTADALRQITGIPVIQSSVVTRAQLPKNVKTRATPEQLDAMTTAYGLALGTKL